MRVLQVMEATIGGTRRHLVDLCRGLAEAGVEVHLCAAAERQASFRDELDRMAEAGVGVHELPMVRSITPGVDRRHYRELCALMRRLRPDIVHTHSSKAGVLGRLAAIRTRHRARVHTPHTFSFLFEAEFSAAKRRLFRTIETTLAKRTGATVAVGSGEARTFEAYGVVPKDRIRVVRNGIDPRPFESAVPTPRSGIGVPEGAPLALVAGLLHVAKGQDLALRTLVDPRLANVHLVLAGPGERRAELESMARELGVSERAHFLGHREDVPGLLATCDWLVLPSRWEGLPYIVLEAMAARRPVVATRVDGATELLEGNVGGTLCEVESVDSLAEGMVRMKDLGPAGRRRLGDEGRGRLEEGFTRDRMVEGTLAVYREVLARVGGSR